MENHYNVALISYSLYIQNKKRKCIKWKLMKLGVVFCEPWNLMVELLEDKQIKHGEKTA